MKTLQTTSDRIKLNYSPRCDSIETTRNNNRDKYYGMVFPEMKPISSA